jgi:hypothetical protein
VAKRQAWGMNKPAGLKTLKIAFKLTTFFIFRHFFSFQGL